MIVSGADHFTFPPPQTGKLRHVLHIAQTVLASWFAEEEACGTRFLCVPVFSAAGVVAYFGCPFEPSWERLLLLAALLAGCAFLSRRLRIVSLLFVFMLFSVIGALCAKAESARQATVIIGNATSTLVTGRIIALEKAERGGYRLLLDIVATEKPVLQPQPQRVRLSARQLPDGAAAGQGLRGRIHLRPPSGSLRPGGYDFAFHSYYRGIGAQGYFMGQPASVGVPVYDSLFARIRAGVAAMRHAVTQRIISAIHGETGAVCAALVTGQRGGISDATNEALRLAGLAHILSISGLHMAMVTGMILVVVRAVTGLFPVFSSRYPSRKTAAFLALCISAFYLLLSGGDIAAQRSFVMVAVMLLAILCDRAAITMRNLAIAALITVLVAPHEIMGPSFQMSFAATAALVAAFDCWSRYRQHREGKRSSLFSAFVLVPLLSTVVASLVAGAASGIFAAFHFGNTAPLGVLSNVLALPVMSLAVMPFALLATLLMPLHLEWLPLQVMAAGVAGVRHIALWIAAVSPVINPGVIMPVSLALLTGGLVVLVCLRSPLRFLSLLPFAGGLMLTVLSPPPLALISGDGRLAAVVNEDRTLAVNTARPAAHVIKNWKSAFHISEVILPQPAESTAAVRGFLCETHLCRARLADGRVLAVAMSAEVGERACQSGDVIFLNYIGLKPVCTEKITITPAQLALYGMAEIRTSPQGPYIVWASGPPSRPWNAHRRFSGAAREMP